MNDKEFEKWKIEKEEENKKDKEDLENFAKKIFKKNPKLIGIMVQGINPKRKYQDYPRVEGIYIENKKVKKSKKKNE